MYFIVNLKMKKPTLCCCFTWIAFIELNFMVAFLVAKLGIVVYPHPVFPGGGELSFIPNFQKKGLAESQFLEEGYWERGV